MEHQREHYRITYPERERPSCLTDSVKLTILNLSESGAYLKKCSFFTDEVTTFPVQIVFRDGVQFSTVANMVRTDPEAVALRFEPFISLAIIFAEQRRLKQLYSHNTD